MRKNRVYTPLPLTVCDEVELPISTSHYLASVLRLQEKSTCYLFNGDGYEYTATLITVSKKRVVCHIASCDKIGNESPLSIHLGQGVSRGERMDYAIQKAVECGVNEITPLLSSRCVVKLDSSRASKRQAHWQAVAVSAAEQSGRCVVPTVNTPISLTAWLAISHAGTKWIADTTSVNPLVSVDNALSTSVMIGPEGGFTEEEVVLAQQAGFYSFSLGPRTLRTETATVVALTLLQSQWGDFRFLE
mgnify:CR=1 FL=1